MITSVGGQGSCSLMRVCVAILELCQCGSVPQCWTSARCDAANVCARVCEGIQGYRFPTENRENRSEFAVGDAGGLLLDGCNRGIVLSDGWRVHVASRAHNLLDGKVGGGAIRVGIVTTEAYIVAKA